MYRIEITDRAKKEIAAFKRSDIASYKKIAKLLSELQQHPRIGTGHPEPLSHGNDQLYSRRINKKDRLIYKIIDEVVTVLVLTTKGHYEDK